MHTQHPDPFPPSHDARAAGVALRALLTALLVLMPALLTGCGGGTGTKHAPPGTVAVLNQSDQGSAPLYVEQFFIEPVSGGASGNRLSSTIPPGGVVILGQFPSGFYNASAVVAGGFNINWVNEEVRPGEPKNFVIP